MRTPKRYEAKDGTESWKVRYRSATGAQKSETFYDVDEATEFCKLLDAVGPARAVAYLDEQDAEKGGRHGAALTVDEVWARWLEWKGARKKDGTLLRVRSNRTLVDYERQWKARVSPTFGSTPANLVSQHDVQDWVEELARELEPKTIADYHSLLHQVYAWAVHPSRGLVVVDPCLETDLPKRRKKKPKGLLATEWHILHRAARDVHPDVADVLLFLVSTGWRWSEAVAVQTMAVEHWEDSAGVSHTYVTMGRVLRRDEEPGQPTHVFVEDAKSDAGQRRVRLMGLGEEMVLRRVYGKGPTDLLLTTPKGGQWGYSYFYDRWWTRPTTDRKDYAPRRKRVLERARELGLDRPGLAPHWLRHTHVGMLILAGEPLTAIQRRLGHASIKTTSDTYGKMIEDASPEGLARAAAMLGGSSQASELEAG